MAKKINVEIDPVSLEQDCSPVSEIPRVNLTDLPLSEQGSKSVVMYEQVRSLEPENLRIQTPANIYKNPPPPHNFPKTIKSLAHNTQIYQPNLN